MSEVKKRKLELPPEARSCPELPPEARKFVEFLRIKTVHPEPDYETCRAWLLAYLEDIGLEVTLTTN